MKNRNLKDSFHNAWMGVRHTMAHERNFKVHTVCAILAVIACIVLRVDNTLFLMVVIAIFSVLGMELINTAVEALTDLYCNGKRHPLAKIAKDTAAAAVLLASIQALVVAAVVAFSVIQRWVSP